MKRKNSKLNAISYNNLHNVTNAEKLKGFSNKKTKKNFKKIK